MTGIDRLISSSLTYVIKKKLNSKILKNLEKNLFFEHGMSIKLSIEYFHKFDETLKNTSNIERKKFQAECIDEIIKIKKLNDSYSIKIVDQKLIDLILESLGDLETRKILYCLFDNDLTIPQILSESKVPKTSGYRKIENLIIKGLILESGKILSENKKISKYRCVFDGLKINVGKNELLIEGVIDKKIFEESTSIKIIN